MQHPSPSDEFTTWTRRFFCLSRIDQDGTPSREEKRVLQEAGLGEIKITIPKTNSFIDLRQKLSEFFPKLKEAGGFQLLRSAVGSRNLLEVIRLPPEGYTTQYLADRCGLGQAIIYVRPLQTCLSVSPVKSQSGTEVFHEKCLKCGNEAYRKEMFVPVQFVECLFQQLILSSMQISVVKMINSKALRQGPRTKIIETTMEMMADADEQDLASELMVKFIGEEGVDAGGLRRELFSLVFEKTPLLDRNTFSNEACSLQHGEYIILGKLVSLTFIYGHPGLKTLHQTIIKYILNEKTPTTEIPLADVQNATVLRAIDTEATQFLGEATALTAEVVNNFYSFSFSDKGDPNWETEEAIEYNFRCFICQVKKGRISSTVINISTETAEEDSIQVTLELVLQAFVGCQGLPKDIPSGLIEFNHNSSALSHVNTCAPSITFQNTSKLLKFEDFERTMLDIIFGCKGFGQK
ncbi:hypothetical protein MAR_017935 [Mya arenaria]|uniref:HECT domain-containing protein n=1 Tax=Mya arenaria TaxID=6604 RepID=A0ABY7EGK0_MYAAR|nr:hypothetical protein MAR_017935 [Mya arenaria]